MSRVSATVIVDGPPERVWEVVADPRNLPVWDRRIAAVHGVPDEGLKVGTEYTTEIRFMGIGGQVRARVRDLDPPRGAVIDLYGRGLRAVVTTRLTPLDGRTVLEQDVEYTVLGGPLGDVLGRALRVLGGEALLHSGVEAQKRQVEEDVRRNLRG